MTPQKLNRKLTTEKRAGMHQRHKQAAAGSFCRANSPELLLPGHQEIDAGLNPQLYGLDGDLGSLEEQSKVIRETVSMTACSSSYRSDIDVSIVGSGQCEQWTRVRIYPPLASVTLAPAHRCSILGLSVRS